MNTTDNLKLPLLKANMPLKEDTINTSLKIIDETISNINTENSQNNNLLPLGYSFYTAHKIENKNYLLSCNQWNDGIVYKDFYNLLLKEYNDPNSKEITKNINENTITYKKTPLDYLITTNEEIANNIYLKDKTTFFILDIENNRFKLPQNTSKILIRKRVLNDTLIEEIYSDGYCIYYYDISGTMGKTNYTLKFITPFKNKNYKALGIIKSISGLNVTSVSLEYNIESESEMTFSLRYQGSVTGFIASIRVEGYIEIDDEIYNPNKYLYYKI